MIKNKSSSHIKTSETEELKTNPVLKAFREKEEE
jgi:hypothetical protein